MWSPAMKVGGMEWLVKAQKMLAFVKFYWKIKMNYQGGGTNFVHMFWSLLT